MCWHLFCCHCCSCCRCCCCCCAPAAVAFQKMLAPGPALIFALPAVQLLRLLLLLVVFGPPSFHSIPFHFISSQIIFLMSVVLSSLLLSLSRSFRLRLPLFPSLLIPLPLFAALHLLRSFFYAAYQTLQKNYLLAALTAATPPSSPSSLPPSPPPQSESASSSPLPPSLPPSSTRYPSLPRTQKQKKEQQISPLLSLRVGI